MKAKYETIKCPKCGYENVKYAKKCHKCHKPLEAVLKTCPRCAKRIGIGENKCSKCGYDFKRKKIAIWINMIISLAMVVFLAVLLLLNKDFIVKKVNTGFRVIAVALIVFLLFNTLTYGSKEVVPLPGDESDAFKKEFKLLKVRSVVRFIITLLLGALCVLCYFIFYR